MKKVLVLPNGVVLLPYLHASGFRRVDLRKGIQPHEQVFTFHKDDGTKYHFDILKLKKMVSNGRYQLQRYAIRPEDIAYIMSSRGIETDHLIRLEDANLDENGLGVVFPDTTVAIIDGNHRMVARYQRQYEFMDFTLLTLEQAKPSMLDLPPEMDI